MEKSITLYFKEGTSDKVYAVQLLPDGQDFVVNFQYGRRGSALKGGTKTPAPVSEAMATKIYDKLVNEKLREGYIEGAAGTPVQQPTGLGGVKKEVHILPQLLNPVDDASVYINDDKYLAEEKFDGDRRMLDSSGTEIMGLNRKGQSVLLPVSIIKSVNKNFTLDGEIIGDKLYCFDILSLDGEDTRQMKCIERVALRNSDLKLGDSIIVVKTAFTTTEKQALYEELIARNAEGIVFKLKNSVYSPGRPNSGGTQLKYKFWKSATFIVENFTPGKRSVGLQLIDEEDNNKKVSVGRVTIPPNKDVPDIGTLIEVRYLYAYKGGRVYQPIYTGVRTDLYIEDAIVSQLIYKAGAPGSDEDENEEI